MLETLLFLEIQMIAQLIYVPTPICNEIVTREYCKPGCIHQIKDW
jgi:hypothetical protein